MFGSRLNARIPDQAASCKPSARPNRICANFVAEKGANQPSPPFLVRMHPKGGVLSVFKPLCPNSNLEVS
jgi:hypothetical protein